MNVQHSDCDADGQGHEYHGEEEVFSEERDGQGRRRDDLGQQEEEDGQRQEDRDAEGHLKWNNRFLSLVQDWNHVQKKTFSPESEGR